MEACSGKRTDDYCNTEEDVEGLWLEVSTRTTTLGRRALATYLEFAKKVYRIPAGIEDVVAKMYNRCGDDQEDEEEDVQ